ncbi:multicopper oxidase domain-containing protein [Candidatus Micrarchaeota archaeon]|nr:multicopper oxidase domain-containing protein [Candidatus Micrarchaeota archaeon]
MTMKIERLHLSAGLALAVLAFAFMSAPVQSQGETRAMGEMTGHSGTVGTTNLSQFDPSEYLTTWNFNNLPPNQRANYYQEKALADGTMLRQYWIYASDDAVEVAPGVFYAGWAYNGQVPGPTIRATEGDTIRIHFFNGGTRAHTAHFHGFHPASMDGAEPTQFVQPGQTFTYEFKAEPAGTHVYHCHSTPLKKHIEKGLYGMFIIDPVGGLSPTENEFVMLMNAFDTDFDGENDVYAVNTVAFAYAQNPIKVKVGEKVRLFLGNMVENDPINSMHIHGNFFQVYPTGTLNASTHYTDIVELAQAERARIEVQFKFPGRYMFHAHQTEFSELGWMGFFEVESNESSGEVA